MTFAHNYCGFNAVKNFNHEVFRWSWEEGDNGTRGPSSLSHFIWTIPNFFFIAIPSETRISHLFTRVNEVSINHLRRLTHDSVRCRQHAQCISICAHHIRRRHDVNDSCSMREVPSPVCVEVIQVIARSCQVKRTVKKPRRTETTMKYTSTDQRDCIVGDPFNTRTICMHIWSL